MRSFGIALCLALIGISACSFLLDTDSLRAGGGQLLPADAGADSSDGPRDNVDASGMCASDFDCPDPAGAGCTVSTCGPDRTCLPPQPYSGLAVAPATDAQVVLQADDIGYPSLLTNQSDILLAAWQRRGTTTDIAIYKYAENPQIGPTVNTLSALAAGLFESYGSSPGMAIRSSRARLLFAADPVGAALMGMNQIDLDVSGNDIRLSGMQPPTPDLAVTGYDTTPRGPVPRLLPIALRDPVGLWVQQGKLYYFDANAAVPAAAEAYSTRRVVGFTPLAGSNGPAAALETTDLASASGSEMTLLWSQGSTSFTPLAGDLPGPRRGVTASATAESLIPLNFVSWAFERGGSPSLHFAGAVCATVPCTAQTLPTQDGAVLPASFPESASARATGSTSDRYFIETYQFASPDPADSSMTRIALAAGASKITTPPSGSIQATTANPPSFLVATTSGPTSAAAGEVLGPSSVAITNNGQILVAWVERTASPVRASLKIRRFQMKTCP